MDGRILAEAFAEPPHRPRIIRYPLRGTGGAGLDDDEQAELAERLKGLGYIKLRRSPSRVVIR